MYAETYAETYQFVALQMYNLDTMVSHQTLLYLVTANGFRSD